MPARFINVSNSGRAIFSNRNNSGRAIFGTVTAGTTTTTTTISMPYYSYGATRCSTGGSVTVISATSLTRFSTYTTGPVSGTPPPVDCYTINTNATMTATAPTHTFYDVVTNCSDIACIQA